MITQELLKALIDDGRTHGIVKDGHIIESCDDEQDAEDICVEHDGDEILVLLDEYAEAYPSTESTDDD